VSSNSNRKLSSEMGSHRLSIAHAIAVAAAHFAMSSATELVMILPVGVWCELECHPIGTGRG